MSAAVLLAQLRALGVRIRINGDNLALQPISAVPENLKAALKAAKPELLAALRAEAEPPPYELLGPSGAGERCTLCGGGRDVERIRHGGEVRLWHRGCADRYVAAMGAPPVPADAADVTDVTADAAPSPPDLDARAAQLMAQAERSSVIQIKDHAAAALYYRGRAALELAPERLDPTIHRMRPPDWSDPRDEPVAGDRCSTCRGSQWWTEGGLPKRGWRCCRCRPPHTAIGVHRVQT